MIGILVMTSRTPGASSLVSVVNSSVDTIGSVMWFTIF